MTLRRVYRSVPTEVVHRLGGVFRRIGLLGVAFVREHLEDVLMDLRWLGFSALGSELPLAAQLLKVRFVP